MWTMRFSHQFTTYLRCYRSRTCLDFDRVVVLQAKPRLTLKSSSSRSHLWRMRGFGSLLRGMQETARRKCVVTFCSPQAVGVAARYATEPPDSPSPSNDVKQMMYRARQRGWLELDLIIGMWAERHAASLAPLQLEHLQALLEEENVDLFKWLTGQIEPPSTMAANSVFKMIKAEVGLQMENNIALPAKSTPGAEWVRGWDDAGAPGASTSN